MRNRSQAGKIGHMNVNRRQRHKVRWVLSLAFSAILFPCPAYTASPSTSPEQQEILNQLGELQKEIKALRGEVGQLRKAVQEIHRSAVRPPQAAAPPPAKVDVALGDGPILGNAAAAVGIVEFTDFQCPFCKRYHDQTFGKLKEAYIDSGKARYALRDFPLNFHAQAKGAAIAARCAGQQDKYWPMHHELFINQRRLGPELYGELGRKLELDSQFFESCLQNPEMTKTVEADLAYGQSVGVRGTPSFFIGRIEDGKLVGATNLSGAQPWATFQRTIDPLLK